MKKIKDLKIRQRKMNRTVRKLNIYLLKDNLWRGRFIAHQTDRWSKQYEDGSGYMVVYSIEFKDLKTGLTKTTYIEDCYDLALTRCHLWYEMNDFITKYCDVWAKEGSKQLYSDKTVYRNK